ncbi:MAG: hypothetical protein KF894_26610 [Labilithrix sp.]|nr:hypothetical protein [Labilithrix sp.]
MRHTPTGASPGLFKTATPPTLSYAARVIDDALIVVGSGGTIARLTLVDLTHDSAFGATGSLVVEATTTLQDVVRDAQGRFVVSGLSASNALFLARVTASGAADATLPLVTSTFTAKPVARPRCSSAFEPYCSDMPSAGRLALQADGYILQAAQVDDAGATKCILARYTPTGQLDTSFGQGGTSTVPIPGCVARRVSIAPDGRILISGQLVVRVWG